MKILSVDDSPMIRKLIRSAVETMGFELVEAGDGLEALGILENRHTEINLVLCDWNMPRLDGYSLLMKMKEDVRFKSIPVTMVTTEVDRLRVIQAIKAGAVNYLMKPFTQEGLITKIKESLGMGI
jgi:two-component system chemotaxis response regulator CheY